ncbi:MAG: hypothetical protein ABI053_05685 [Lacisediminihabitans sp.]
MHRTLVVCAAGASKALDLVEELRAASANGHAAVSARTVVAGE